MAKSTFGILLALAGLALVWGIVTGRLKRLTNGDITIHSGTGSVTGSASTAAHPAATPAVSSTNSAAASSTNDGLVSGGPYLPIGTKNYGIPSGPSLGLDPSGAVLG